ncbi:MAG TPA: hypothetical protein VGF45_18130 [Polyangia bacterium]
MPAFLSLGVLLPFAAVAQDPASTSRGRTTLPGAIGLALAGGEGPDRGEPPRALRWSPAGQAPRFDLAWVPLDQRLNLPAAVGRLLPEVAIRPDGVIRVRGSGENDQTAFLDGFRLDNAHQVPWSALDDIAIHPDGLSAARGDVAGAAIDLGTQDTRRRGARVDFWHAPERGERRRGSTYHPTSTALDGAITTPLDRARRLGLLTSVRLRTTSFPATPDPFGEFPPTTESGSRSAAALLKVDYAATVRQRFQSLVLVARSAGENGDPWPIIADAQPVFAQSGALVGLGWQGHFGTAWVAHTRLGYQRGSTEESSNRCARDPEGCRFVSPIRDALRMSWFENRQWHRADGRETMDLANTLSWSHNGAWGLAHTTRLSSRLRLSDARAAQSMPGDGSVTLSGIVPQSRTEVFTSDPQLGPGRQGWWLKPTRAFKTVHALDHTFSFRERLAARMGLAFVTSAVRSPFVRLAETGFAPTVDLRWQPLPSGSGTLRIASSIRLSDELEEQALVAGGTPFSRTCRFDAATETFTGACQVEGGFSREALQRLCGADGEGFPGCKGSAALPRTREHILGWEQMWQIASVGAHLVYRKTDRLGGLERLTNWGLAEDLPATLAAAPRPLRIVRSTDPVESRRYLGATLSASAQAFGATTWLAYTQSTLTNDNGADPAADRPHAVRAIAQYAPGFWGSVGVFYAYESGLPYRYLFEAGGPRLTPRRLPVGRGPGRDLNDPNDDVDLRLPGLHQLNLQARFKLPRWGSSEVALFADVVNALNGGRPTAVDERANNFGIVTANQGVRSFLLGLSFAD